MCASVCFLFIPTDLITVGYEFTVYTTSEGRGMVELSVIISNPPSGGASRPFVLSVNTQDGTAGIYILQTHCMLFTAIENRCDE